VAEPGSRAYLSETPRSAGDLHVDAVENPFLSRKSLSEWRDPRRAIRHFTD